MKCSKDHQPPGSVIGSEVLVIGTIGTNLPGVRKRLACHKPKSVFGKPGMVHHFIYDSHSCFALAAFVISNRAYSDLKHFCEVCLGDALRGSYVSQFFGMAS